MKSERVVTRRTVLRASALAAAGGFAAAGRVVEATGREVSMARASYPRGEGKVRIGVIGCGGRGTGAAADALEASDATEIVALGDVFPEQVQNALKNLKGLSGGRGERVRATAETCFHGFDAFREVIASGCDAVILATAPHFRPMHFEVAVAAGKHVFMEKPVAVDPTGVRKVLAAAKAAEEKKLSVVAGTQRRHEGCYLEAMRRLQGGELGEIVGANVAWNQGGLWVHERRPEWSDMEWQVRNWLYFTWLSGDHIVEQHVHNLDVAMWAMGGPPARVTAMGGREMRKDPKYGHIFDHFACDFEWADGRHVASYCRQIDGCSSRVDERIECSRGTAILSSGSARFKARGGSGWAWEDEQQNPYVREHADLLASIQGTGPYVNEGAQIAQSTLMAIMGRMSAYTGKSLTWEQALNSGLDLTPPAYGFGPLEPPEVARPGQTKFM